jgi:outer membrane protein
MTRRLLFPCCFFLAATLWSQTPGETFALTLEDCIERALRTDTALQRKAIDVQTAQLAARNIWAEFFPSIDIGASLAYEDSFADPKKKFPDNVTYNVPADITLTLSSILPIPLNVKITQQAYETQLREWQTERRNVSIRISQNFYKLLVDQASIALLEETLALAERQLEKDNAQFRGGLTNELTVLRSRLSVENARFNTNKARREWRQNASVFLSGAGFTNEEINGVPIVLSGTIEMEPLRLDADQLIEAFLPGHPDVTGAVADIQRLELTASRTALTQRGPLVSVSGSYRGNTVSGSLDGTKQPFSDSFSARLAVSLPLDSWIPGGKGAQTVAAAHAETEKARLNLRSVRQNAENAIRSIVENMENTLYSIRIARLRAETAERAYRMSETAFERGAIEALDYENARASWAEARQDLLREQLAYKNFALELEKELNIDPGQALTLPR